MGALNLTMNSSTFFSFIPFKSHFFVIFGLFWGPPEAPHLCPIYPYGPWPLVLLLTRLTRAKRKKRFHDFVRLSRFVSLKTACFCSSGHIKSPSLEPKFCLTVAYGVIPLVLCFGSRSSFKKNLNDEFWYFFFIFSL